MGNKIYHLVKTDNSLGSRYQTSPVPNQSKKSAIRSPLQPKAAESPTKVLIARMNRKLDNWGQDYNIAAMLQNRSRSEQKLADMGRYQMPKFMKSDKQYKQFFIDNVGANQLSHRLLAQPDLKRTSGSEVVLGEPTSNSVLNTASKQGIAQSEAGFYNELHDPFKLVVNNSSR